MLGDLATITMGQSPDSSTVNDTGGGLPFLQGCAEFGSRFPQPRFHCSPPLRVAKSGSILISVRAPVGTTNRADQDYCIGRGLGAVLAKPGVADDVFLLHAIEANLEFLHRRSQGSTFLAIGSKELSSLPVPALEFAVQRRIAEILSTLDEAIAQTEALIAKHQQIKAGLMHDLFTRGVTTDGHLRPTREQAPDLYKESQLGWIPKEWEVKLLGALAEIVSGVTLGAKGEISDEVGVPYLRVANVQDGYFDLTEVKTIQVSRSQFEKLQLRYGDVLMNEGGDFDKLGRGSVWREEIKPCIHQNHVFRVRPRDGKLRSYFLAFWSQSELGKKYFVLNSKQSTNLASINSTQLNRFPVALPSAIEQEQIEARIVALNDHADSLEQEVSKLRQQKHGLMHDLLTGKVRVAV
jgi:type I restriction enzyme S subunit